MLALADLKKLAAGLAEVVVGPKVVLTPCAREELQRLGIVLVRRELRMEEGSWGLAQDRRHALVEAAVAALAREGKKGRLLEVSGILGGVALGRAVGEKVAQGMVKSAVLFCQEPEAAACAANKLPGLRAAAVCGVPQAKRAQATLGANFLAVEMPGRTYFEIRAVLDLAALTPSCPKADLEVTDARR